MPTERVVIVGAGIVGLAVARQVAISYPGTPVTVIDKEDRVGAHQTSHNSGVAHAGLYYVPGSLKATLCRRGVGLLREYCQEHGIAYQELGKLVVATSTAELPGLERIRDRAERNGVPDLARLDRAGLLDIEPWTDGVAALHSPHTAVVDFAAVAGQLAAEVVQAGGEVLLGHPVTAIEQRLDGVHVTAGSEHRRAARLIACAGLGSDGIARLARRPGDVRIIPFRGEYYRLAPSVRERVRGLIYPVPDPRYPFLGVHLTRTAGGEVLVGPNAVPALAREGYRRRDIDWGDLRAMVTWPGSRALARAHWRTGVHELVGSFSKRAFTASARRYLPSLLPDDLEPAPAGVRAQAVDRSGNLLDDFSVDVFDRVVLVRNAPSPAATSSLAIAEYLLGTLDPAAAY